jgi:acetyl esterase/lipase
MADSMPKFLLTSPKLQTVLLLALAGFGSIVIAQSSATSQTLKLEPGLQVTAIPLWPDAMPGTTQAATNLTVFEPQPGAGVGTAVIVAPGGAYLGLAMNLEGRQPADWFAARGITAFVLKYRLGPKDLYPIPLQDMQQAIRTVRSLEKKYKLVDDRIGIVGFSAGGHLAALASTSFDGGDPASKDLIEEMSDKPDFVVLAYPWLNAMQPQVGGKINYCSILHLPQTACLSFEHPYTPVEHVSSSIPPTFIFSTSDDAIVPVAASVTYYTALQKAGVPAELHIFKHGAHGSGLGGADDTLNMWPLLLDHWLRGLGLLTKPAPIPNR